MANVRSTDKKRLNIWIDKDLARKLSEYAEEHHQTITDVLVELIEQLLEKQGEG